MVELGRFALLVGLGAAAWAAIAGFVGARTGRETAVRSAEGGLRAAALSLTVASAGLFYAFLTRDFSVQYVAEYSSRSLALLYTIGAFWAGQPGSLLLWAWVLSIYAAIVVRQNRSANRDLMPWVVTVLAVALAFFTFLVAFASDPFARLPFTPPDGQGLNPMLQNYGQFIHPVTLYMGYVGFTVPFAFCVAALVTGNLSDRWIRTVRKWTLWAWILLTAGIVFGARWAYVELGWGGYWAWDPVENASLMPWLVGTAYLHSVMIQEKRGMLKVWNVFLIVATFGLSIFGTFLTRSGVVSSVHAFAESSIGPFLVAAVASVVLVGGGLIAWRMPELRSSGRLDSVVSRESSFLLNNLLLVGMAFAVFWGTVFPMVAEAVRGVKVSVGAPFFQTVVTPMGVALLALVGLCPLIAWRKASLRNLRRNFLLPVAGGLGAFAVLALLTRGRHLGADVVLALSAFVTITLALEYGRGARVRRQTRGESWSTAFTRLFSRNPRRYGGYLIHLGVVVVLVGIVLHVAFKQEVKASNLPVGRAIRVGDYSLTLREIGTQETPAKFATFATFSVADALGGGDLGQILAERSFYAGQEQPTTEVGIRSTLAEDLYVILRAADPENKVVSVVLLVNPGVFWLWFGALMVIAGGAIVAWPARKRKGQRREEVTDASERELEPVPV